MAITSLQVCMDTSDWSQGVNHEDSGIDSSSPSPSGDIMACLRLQEKRLRPDNDQTPKCPRCNSTHTKFCYYNNYSLTQPRYFCKACRRYWTKGGSLRNIPVGGGCRKNKRMAGKKSNENTRNQYYSNSSPLDPTHLQLSFPNVQLTKLTKSLGNSGSFGSTSSMDRGSNAVLENSGGQVDGFMESKFDAILGSSQSHDFMGTNDLGIVDSIGDIGTSHEFRRNLHDLSSPYGIAQNENKWELIETNHRLLSPFESEGQNGTEVNPNFLSLDWQDHGYYEFGKDSIGYLDTIGSWNTAMNGYTTSATNSLI